MSGERRIRFERRTPIDTRCNANWRVSNSDPTFLCPIHQTEFYVSRSCPDATQLFEAGEEASMPAGMAERLVRNGFASFPDVRPQLGVSDQRRLDSLNAIMESEGLPQLDPEFARIVSAQGRTGSRSGDPYGRARAKDVRLAAHTGLDAMDIAEMRKLAGGKG